MAMRPGLNDELTPGKYVQKIRKPKSCSSRCKQTCRELANWLSCLFCRCESHSDRGHAMSALLFAVVPVLVSLVVQQTPSMLTTHRVEELALLLWGGWSIGAIGGAFSAYQTHLSWRRGSAVQPADVVCLELLFAAAVLLLFPRCRSANLASLCCGLLAMSSVVVELGRSRVLHDALSPSRHAEASAAYRRGVKPPIALVAAVGLARHSVLVDIAAGFLSALGCLGAAGVRALVTGNLAQDLDAVALDGTLPDLTPCFLTAACLALLASAHFALVRYQDYASAKAAADVTSDSPVEAAANAASPALAKGSIEGHVRRGRPGAKASDSKSGELGTDGDGELSDDDDHRTNSSNNGHQRKQKPKRSSRKAVSGNAATSSAAAATTTTSKAESTPQNPTSPNDNARVEQAKLHVVRGKWLALQASFSLALLYGGRLLATSLFASFYVALPTYSKHLSSLGLGPDAGSSTSSSSSSSSSGLGEQVANSRHAAVEAAVCLWATSLVGALMASNVVSRWTLGRRNRANDLALTRIGLCALGGTSLGPLVVALTTNRAVAWICLAAYGGFNGFASVVCLALYTRRLPVTQAIRVSVVKAAANGFSGFLPCICALLWTAGYHPTADGTTAGAYHPYSASTNKRALMLTLAATGLLPLCTLVLIYRQQRNAKDDASNAAYSKVLGNDLYHEPSANPTSASSSPSAGAGRSSVRRGNRRSSSASEKAGRAGGSSEEEADNEDKYVQDDGELDLESYFMDYRLKQMQEKLAVAAREIEDQMEEYDFGTDDDDDDEEENPFGDREEATGLLADV